MLRQDVLTHTLTGLMTGVPTAPILRLSSLGEGPGSTDHEMIPGTPPTLLNPTELATIISEHLHPRLPKLELVLHLHLLRSPDTCRRQT